MPIGRTRAVALLGLDGALVEVEADISAQPARVSCSSGCPTRRSARRGTACGPPRRTPDARLPNRKLTVNLSPAALPKHGSGFDLAIAIASLAAAGSVDGGVGRARRAPRRTRPRRPAAPDQRHPARGARRVAGRVRAPSWCRAATRTRRRWSPASGSSASPRCATRRSGTAASSSPSRSTPSRGRCSSNRAEDAHRTSPTSSATRMPWRPCWSPRRAGTTSSCSGRPARARPCSPRGCPGSCPISTPRPRSRSARSARSPGCRSASHSVDASAVRGPAPHRDRRGARRRRQRRHPPGRRGAGLARRAVPRRGARVRLRRARRACGSRSSPA